MQGQTSHRNKHLAKALRKRMTDAERRLWHGLRSRQMAVKFRRQHPFNGYVLDFVCLELKLVIEVDGGQHAEDAEHDAARTRALERAGFRVLRFWNNEVLMQTDAVLERIFREINPSPPQPSP
ncbi:endonuclease domain-containing protein [Nitrogeniibacter mangrovi]|uniref:Endonuclease domain-containing protein n=1 Tax=Nitrogeniibacter mangrovi TaxID=2016596 RepID=A0A6C1B2L4_9RHOO|nr:DUF559 domain-containing protein [Nitrogeniibacter mangrovi]QID17068.1 endonuclease domain-containing protein [Nitrogeniibacter mangrovi]